MITALHFENNLEIDENIDTKKVIELVNSKKDTWIDVVSEPKKGISEILKSIFQDYHSLILEDITENTRPKIEVYDGFIFIVLKTYPFGTFKNSQINIILGKTFLLTIHTQQTSSSTSSSNQYSTITTTFSNQSTAK